MFASDNMANALETVTNTYKELSFLYDVGAVSFTGTNSFDPNSDKVGVDCAFFLKPVQYNKVLNDGICEIFDFAARFGCQIQWGDFKRFRRRLCVTALCVNDWMSVQQTIANIPNHSALQTLISMAEKGKESK